MLLRSILENKHINLTILDSLNKQSFDFKIQLIYQYREGF